MWRSSFATFERVFHFVIVLAYFHFSLSFICSNQPLMLKTYLGNSPSIQVNLAAILCSNGRFHLSIASVWTRIWRIPYENILPQKLHKSRQPLLLFWSFGTTSADLWCLYSSARLTSISLAVATVIFQKIGFSFSGIGSSLTEAALLFY